MFYKLDYTNIKHMHSFDDFYFINILNMLLPYIINIFDENSNLDNANTYCTIKHTRFFKAALLYN